MGMWTILEEGREDNNHDFGMRENSEIERAYKEGCHYGYEKAIREMQGSEMGERNRAYRINSYNMGERRMPGYLPESPYYDMGERGHRRYNGQYY